MIDPENPQLSSAILDALPFPLFVVDEDVRIVAFNGAATPMLGDVPALALNRKGGEALHCIHSTEALGGCGASEACKTCVVRAAVGRSIREKQVVRRPQRMLLVGPRGARDIYVIITASPLQGAGQALAALMFQDIGELISTQGIVPICMHCGKVRETPEQWAPMERYLKNHLDLDMSHGLCPECMRKHYPDYADP